MEAYPPAIPLLAGFSGSYPILLIIVSLVSLLEDATLGLNVLTGLDITLPIT